MIQQLSNFLSIEKNVPWLKSFNEEFKQVRLLKMARSILESAQYGEELYKLIEKLGLSEGEVLDAFLKYNMNVYDHGNEIYEIPAIRVVLHIHNLIEGSWHIERQETVSAFINAVKPEHVLDLGFGVPTRYVNELLPKTEMRATLCDFSETAIKFSKELLGQWDNKWRKKVSLIQQDMTEFVKRRNLSKYDFIIFQDSIEHVEDPTNCLKKYVSSTSPQTYFLLSIPLGPITPEHYMEWKEENDAVKWINDCGLKILASKTIYTKPGVDLFAEVHNFNYSDYYALCFKQ